MSNLSGKRGFTLIEILLVVVIIGIMLSVIVPRAWRANVDAKYTLVRQSCTELASFAQGWAESQMAAQEEASTCKIVNYLNSLASKTFVLGLVTDSFTWLADTDASNWNSTGSPVSISGRNPGGSGPDTPEKSVEDMIPPEKMPRNPFSGSAVFHSSNYPASADTPIAGAIACGEAVSGNSQYFGLIWQGTGSNVGGCATDGAEFYAGQSTSLEGLRNGVFLAQVGAD